MAYEAEYNPSGIAPGGATQVGNVAIATNSPNYSLGSWVGGVNTEDGYVIVNDTTTMNLSGRGCGGGTGFVPANTPTYWKSSALTDQALIDLINSLPTSPANFLNVTDARNWLSSTTYGIINDLIGGAGGALGVYYLVNQYAPALQPGWITFPNHEVGSPDNDPNHVGQTDNLTFITQIYINRYDNNIINQDNDAIFSQFVNRSGTLTLTQGMNSVTYGFTNQAFQYFNDNLFADNYYESSPLGSITILSPASGPFNFNDPISVDYTLI